MDAQTLTPSIEVAMGRELRLYHAYVQPHPQSSTQPRRSPRRRARMQPTATQAQPEPFGEDATLREMDELLGESGEPRRIVPEARGRRPTRECLSYSR
jgi:hypothetical protein